MAAAGGIYVEDYSHLEEEAKEIAHIDLIDEELLQRTRNTAWCIFISARRKTPGGAGVSAGAVRG